MDDAPTILVVDDDPGSIRSICSLLEQEGLAVRAFTSGREFLDQLAPDRRGCVLLDLRMPEIDGLEVVERLMAQGVTMPIIVVTGSADTRSCVRAFKMGIFDFLEKPIDPRELIEAVRKALAHDAASPRRAVSAQVASTLALLTAREKEVFQALMAGKSLKQIAARRNVTVQSVWKHQQNILAKFGVSNEVELINLMRGAEKDS